MNISNKEDANKYYDIINKYIDNYIDNWKIKPSKLYKYLKLDNPKFKSFLKRNGLSEISGIKRIILDVIEDRKHMELDGVMKFERFKLNESFENSKDSPLNLWLISPPTIEHEKIISDAFNISLGHISNLNENIHLYEIDNFGKKSRIIIFSEDELNLIYKKIEDKAYNFITNKLITIDKIDKIILNHPIKFISKDIIDEKMFRNTYKDRMNKNTLLLTIVDLIQSEIKSMPIIKHKTLKNYHIWEINSETKF